MRAVPTALLLGGVAMGHAVAQTPIGATEAPVAASPMVRPVSAPAEPQGRAVDVLIRQAERWLAQDRYDLATASIDRALAAEPRNAAALAVAARIAAASGNRPAAATYATRLRAAGATEEQRTEAENAVRGATVDRVAIEEARRLAREGRAEEAAARYRQIFGAQGPTPAFAQEYYSVLAGTAAGRDAGRAGLARLADGPTASPRARLAFAQNQTFQPATRADGIARLQALTNDTEVGAEARRAWRQALIWSVADPAYAPQIQAYLQRFGDDAELRRGLEAARSAAAAAEPDPNAQLRQEGFAVLESGSAAGLRDGARRFEAALTANPRDADALGGLGIVRLREGRAAEARQLLERAVAADPARAGQWQGALDGASYGLELAEARAALRRNDIDGADTIARSAARRQVEDRTDIEVLLGQIALRRGEPAAAEQRFRTALSRRPGFGPARDGLNQSLRAQGRLAEAPSRADRVSDIAGGPSAGSGAGRQLRAEANRAMDPAVGEALLRQALTTQPDDPWVRLDLARALRRQGRGGEGRSLMEEQVARAPRADSFFAAALFADEDGRPIDAESYLNRIPPTARNRDMSQLQARIRTQRDVARAASLLASNRAEARTQLLTIAARPDPSGATAAAVIRAFGEANERFAAAEAARVGEAANRASGAGVRVAIAGAMLGAGFEAEALALADQAEAGTLTAEQRRDVASLRAGIAVRASDRLNEEGQQAQAFERLRPALERDPENVDANLALARLYQGAREPAEALRVAEAVLARNPRNFEARQGAVSAAIALGQRSRAEQLLAEGRDYFPNDSRVSLMEARIARAFNQDTRARRALATAQAQRQAEVGQVASLPSGMAARTPTGMQNPFARPGATVPLQSVAGPAAAQPTDRVAREIAQEIAALEQVAAGRATLQAGLRQRSGSQGLDRLQEITGGAEAEVTPPGLGGRLTTTVTGVAINTGALAPDAATQQRFGSNAAFGSTQTPRNNASGVMLGAAYRRGEVFRADIASSPIGFPSTTILGGLEVAPQIGQMRLRLTGERRSVTDSLLSWAGQRDRTTGRNWGMVVRTGGRGQLEMPLGAGFAYVGGGYSVFDGENVANNNRVEGGAGFSYPVISQPGGELRVGADLVYFAYDRNLRFFTLGHGGYYSPQSFAALNVPLDYRGRSGDFSYRLGGTVGYAVWREETTPLFPNNPGLQQAAVARAATDPTVITSYNGQSRQNFVGGLRADLDYQVTPGINLAAGFRYDKSANWDETRVLLRLNGRF
nr:cellulose synthase subunit BcsC-related outer membrane protein [uncultured Roseococcus sp.]